jgi:lipoprotein NlpD
MRALAGLALLLALGACSTTRVSAPAPVEDRGAVATQSPAVAAAPVSPSSPVTAPLPGQENAGKPGYYTVRPGDSLIRIGLDVGQNWRDLARWNDLDNPNKIEVGQVLRVVAPTTGPSVPAQAAPAVTVVGAVAASTSVPAAGSAGAASAPVAGPGAVVGQPLPAAGASTPASAAPTAVTPPVAKTTEDNIAFIWPTEGTVVAAFDDAKNKGIDIAGKAGQPVVAAADGRVAYAGAAIRGLGNLIILKHSNTLFTAYAHNQTLLVKEDQNVKQGQKIAEMGSSDTDRVKLHFEIRRKGTPVDPVKLLPAR